MDVLLAHRAGDNFHRTAAVVPPGPSPDLRHAAASRGKQRGMPREEPFNGEWLLIVARGVERHFDDALHVAVRRRQCADIHSKSSGNRGSDLIRIQLLALDFAALEHIGGQGLKVCFLTEAKSKRLHVADQPTLPVADSGQTLGEQLAIPGKPRPVLQFMDIHSPHLLRRLSPLIAARSNNLTCLLLKTSAPQNPAASRLSTPTKKPTLPFPQIRKGTPAGTSPRP